VVDARMSTRSKKGREALFDLADAILAQSRDIPKLSTETEAANSKM